MAAAVEEAVNALRGNLTENCKLPVPRIVKIYIASHKSGK